MNEFPLFFQFIAINIGRKVKESSNVILPRPHFLPENKEANDCEIDKSKQ
jgi:hypothetical protein